MRGLLLGVYKENFKIGKKLFSFTENVFSHHEMRLELFFTLWAFVGIGNLKTPDFGRSEIVA